MREQQIVPYIRVCKEEQIDKMEERLDYLLATAKITEEEHIEFRTNLSVILEDESRRCKERVMKRHE